MARSRSIRLGVVGLGMGRNHALACLDLPEVELVAVAEPRAERLEQLKNRPDGAVSHQEQLAAVQRYDDYKTMIRDERLDAVSLALPTDIHASASEWCLKAGVHVLCEKPPTTSAAQMKQVWKVAKDRDLTYAYVRQQRFQPHKWAARELATTGKLGTITHAESHWLRSRGIPWREGWGVNKDAGGGVLLDLGIHIIDDAWFLMGNPEPEALFAGMHCNFSHLAKGRTDLTMPYNADDHTVGLIRFVGGATLSLSTSFALNRVKEEHRQPSDGPIERSEWLELGVYGHKASVDLSKKLLISHHAEGVTVKDLPIPKRLAKMRTNFQGLIGDFANAILDHRPPLNDARQALQLMRMLDALKKSAHTGRSVTLKPLDD